MMTNSERAERVSRLEVLAFDLLERRLSAGDLDCLKLFYSVKGRLARPPRRKRPSHRGHGAFRQAQGPEHCRGGHRGRQQQSGLVVTTKESGSCCSWRQGQLAPENQPAAGARGSEPRGGRQPRPEHHQGRRQHHDHQRQDKRSEVKGIEKGPTAAEKTLAEVEKRRAALKDDDAAGWLEFAQWLDRLTGFSQDARAAYEKVVRLDPENEAARRKLGYQKIGGQWLTEAEIMTAKGLVLHNGKWVTPEEKKKAEESLARQLDDIRIALADETRKPDGELPAGPDARRLELWRRAMEEIAKQRAAQYGPDYVGSTSGGPTMGPYGYGYYGVYTSTGEYLPFVPSGGIYYYTAGSCWPGSAGTWGSSWGSYYGLNFHYKDKHIDLHWGR